MESNNQSQQVCKQDAGKLRYDLCPPQWAEALAEVMTGGLAKYEPNSWQTVEAHRYEAALMRHFIAWRKGQIMDKESGLNHLKHVMANAAILLTLTDKQEKSDVNRSFFMIIISS